MKIKVAVEMEFDIPDIYAKKFKGRVDEFCVDLAKAISDETASSMTIAGIGVKYEDCSWLQEHEAQYKNGILYSEVIE